MEIKLLMMNGYQMMDGSLSLSEHIQRAVALFERKRGERAGSVLVSLKDFEKAGSVRMQGGEAEMVKFLAVRWVTPGTILVGGVENGRWTSHGMIVNIGVEPPEVWNEG